MSQSPHADLIDKVVWEIQRQNPSLEVSSSESIISGDDRIFWQLNHKNQRTYLTVWSDNGAVCLSCNGILLGELADPTTLDTLAKELAKIGITFDPRAAATTASI